MNPPDGRPADLVVRAGTVITMDPDGTILTDGAIAIADGSIVGIGTHADIARAFSAGDRIHLPHGIALPGLIDVHQHAGHGFVRTVGDDLDRWMETCERLYLHGATPATWYAEARLTGLERLMAGTTTALTMFGGAGDTIRADDAAHARAHLDGIDGLGLRSVIAVGPGSHGFPKRTTRHTEQGPQAVSSSFTDQMGTLEAVEAAARRNPRLGVAATFPTLTPDAITDEVRGNAEALATAAGEGGMLIVQDGHRATTVEATADLGLLTERTVLSHATDLDAAHIEAIADARAMVAHNPSAIFSQLGRCPVPELQEAGVTVGLGSDATAPDRSADMFRHLFQLTRYHRADRRDPSLFDPVTALAMATSDAARLVDAEDRLGSLTVGRAADVIVVDADVPHLTPLTHPIHQLVYFATGADIDTVIVDGVVLMQRRTVRSDIDPTAILREARIERDAAFAHMEA